MVGSAVLAVLAVAVLLVVRGYEIWSFGTPGPGLMPLIGAGLMLVASLAALRRDFAALRREPAAAAVPAWPSMAYIGAFAALLPLTTAIGLLPALGLLCAGILRVVERQSTTRALAVAAATMAGSWLLFEWALSVPLPHGWIGGR